VAAERSDRWTINLLTPREWAILAEEAHRLVFRHISRPEADRIDFAVLAVSPDIGPIGFATCRWFDDETIYLQYGGAAPEIRGTTLVLPLYLDILGRIRQASEKCKRFTTLVENENIAYLRLAFKAGFRIIGTRTFKGTILVELLWEF
jgi:RimJ/RimL family protein N-acetyltransferase